MLIINTALQNTPIMSLQTGGQLGQVLEPIIDPRKLQVVAFYVGGPRIHSVSVLHATDIREVGPLGIIVNAADDIMELDEDLVRLKEVVSLRFSLVGKTVIDDTKKKLGKVSEFSIETDGFTIQKLHVTQSIMKNITNASLIIGRAQVLEVTDNEIIVRSATVPEATGLAQLVNPFRRPKGSLAPD